MLNETLTTKHGGGGVGNNNAITSGHFERRMTWRPKRHPFIPEKEVT